MVGKVGRGACAAGGERLRCDRARIMMLCCTYNLVHALARLSE